MDAEKRWTLKRLFTKPKGIKTRFIFTYLVLAAIPLLLAGTYGVYYSVHILEDATLHHLKYELSSKAGDIEKFLKNTHSDILFLSRSEAVRDLIEYKGPRTSHEHERLRKKVESETISFSRTRTYFYQIRYIDEYGYEIMRVDSDGVNPTGIPSRRHQYKGDRYYFKDALEYSRDECYVSPMDLNIEYGEIESPHKPVVRIATPVFDSGDRKRGILIINIYASFLVEQIKELNISKGGATFLVNKEGFYLSLLNSKAGGHNAFRLGSTESLVKDYSFDTVSRILSGKPGTIGTENSIISFNPIHTGDSRSGEYWVLALVYPKDTIFAPVRTLEIIFVLIGSMAALAAFLTGLWMAKRFTEPILKLHDGVEWVACGDFNRKIDIETGDEVEQLARRFNDMAGVLKAYRERMEKWNEELKKEVALRSRDLNIEKNKLEQIIICANEGILIANKENRVIIFNPAMEAILGINKEEVLWKKISECHRIPEKIRELVDESPSVLQQPLILDSGAQVLEISMASINFEGETFGSRLVVRDITERHKLMEERMTMERQLFHADKLVSLGELSAGIAHEIGNPLAAIKTVIQAMDDERPFAGEQKKYMKRILKEVNRLSTFLRTFSAYAHPLVNQTAKTRIDLALREVVFLIKNEALKHNVIITNSVSKNTPYIALDADQLKQIFINLFLNAIQAMPDGGSITVTAAAANSRRSSAVLSIADTGPGIPAEIVNNIFDPFFTTKQTGTGLGLSIVYRLINEHKGKIKVRSAVGSGTTFEILLPAAGAAESLPCEEDDDGNNAFDS